MNRASSAERHTPRQNQLLAALPPADYERLAASLELVPLALGRAMYESGARLDYAYFPTNCVVSLLSVTQDGSSAEIAITGREGMVGIALFMGGETTSSRAVVQNAGYAYRVPRRWSARSSTAAARCSCSSCATPSRSSRKWRRPRCATGIIRSTSSYAAGCCSASTGCLRSASR